MECVCAAKKGVADLAKLTVAITGATGFVGTRLAARLIASGASVKALTRDVSKARARLPRGVTAVAPGEWDAAIRGCDAVVNLAGEPIATRWSDSIKAEIRRSRIGVTRRLADAINALPPASRPRVLVSASAIGFYGTSDSSVFKEDAPAGRDVLAEVCVEWEAAARAADTRVVLLRTGIVLGRGGGVLAKMVPIFQLFTGGPLGTGQQWMSWIHLDDLVGLYVAAIADDSYEGVYNATAPAPARMGEFCARMGAQLGRPSWLPVPDFAIRGLLGEGATVVLDGQKVLPARTQAAGFQFKYTDLDRALASLLR